MSKTMPPTASRFSSAGYIAPKGLKNVLSGGSVAAIAAANHAILMDAIDDAVASSRILSLTGSFTLDASVVIDATHAGLLVEMMPGAWVNWVGDTAATPFEIKAACNIASLYIDMQRAAFYPTLDRSLDTTPVAQPAIGIHGTMTTGAPAVLSGVKAGRIEVRNARSRNAIVLANLIDADIGELIVSDSYGAATLLSGLQRTRVGLISGIDVGYYGPESGRYGQVAAIYCESDPLKSPASWYTIGAQADPDQNVLPFDGLFIDRTYIERCTDTGVYVHDYAPGAGTGFNIGGVHIGAIDALHCGKDVFKARNYAKHVHVGRINSVQSGNRVVAIEDGAEDVHVGWVNGETVGYDVIGLMKGVAAPYTGANGGRDQTLTTAPIGVDISSNVGAGYAQVANVSIGGGHINGVPLRYDNASGWGLRVEQSYGVKVALVTQDTGSIGAYFNSANVNADVDVRNANRNAADISNLKGIAVVANASSGSIRYRARELSGAAVSNYAFRAANSCVDLAVHGAFKPADFLRPGFNNVGAILNGQGPSVTHNAVNVSRGSTTIVPGAGGLTASIPHNCYTTPRLKNATVADAAQGVAVFLRSIDSVNMQLWVKNAATGAAITTSVTIDWEVEVRKTDGV